MKKMFLIGLLAAFGLCSYAQTQNSASEMMQQAQESLDKQSYIKARYLFLQAYNAFATEGNYQQAVVCGVNASALYHRENYYKEAFELLGKTEQTVTAGEQKAGKELPALRYPIIKERMRMYLNIGKTGNAQAQLEQLEETAKKAASDSLQTDLLYTQAAYFYTLRQQAKGDAAIKKLIDESNRMQAAQAQAKFDTLKQQYDSSLQTISEAAGLVGVVLVMLRFMVLARKQKKAIGIANEHNKLKTQFIQNISAQMEPTLATLDAKQPGVQALHVFTKHIQELAELESSLAEPYEMQEKNVSTFCEEVMGNIQELVRKDVSLAVNAPRLTIKICPEPLEQLLLHLLKNAAYHTPEGGKIWLDFKKRGAHTHQFVVTDTGCGIPEEQRANLFKPFSEIKDLTKGDGLGLPICALMAIRMNGSLTLDTNYTKGARFVLELHV